MHIDNIINTGVRISEIIHFEWRDSLFLFNAHQNIHGFGLVRFWIKGIQISEGPLYISHAL